ncbi:hypothetical protein A3D81_00435 [Candidatus Curtissbacteria bacterium RIFCSPHIGHO2_02_FULL_40_17]|uniref:DUF1656 domain-containing protein n=1 Tax=Candidatus Curtissbacteria bacterium RIFCSPHIGHO2_02_FULL_40_17 TaxID=1797715 RepID=A0A1F5GGG4_9BACT|nr:MAG: hypothetical protein A3D81_00435 [Candidatus Curtissbacteria bacterium RIFCSPHIGHO2_02_FULL_40_17]
MVSLFQKSLKNQPILSLLPIFSVVVGLLYLVAVRAVVKSSLLRYYKTWPHALLYFVCVPIGLGLLYMAVAILLE